jgi:hypothetical protein
MQDGFVLKKDVAAGPSTCKKNNFKHHLNEEGKLKQRRLSKKQPHVIVSTSDERIPLAMRNKQHRCVVCCALCTTAEGKVKARDAFHSGKDRNTSAVKSGAGRLGHKTKFMCITCGYVPMCKMV